MDKLRRKHQPYAETVKVGLSMASKIFKDPSYVEGKGWYVVRKDTYGKRYLRKCGEVMFGVFPDGYFKTRDDAIKASREYEKKIGGANERTS
jgi:hypothetical protein